MSSGGTYRGTLGASNEHSSSFTYFSRAPIVAEVEVVEITRHPIYYIPSGDVVFLVGSQLFRVHRYFFVRESATFRDMLSSSPDSPEDGKESVGSMNSSTIPLSNVTKEEFASFLRIFYKENYEYEASLEEWSAILRLAHMWNFPKVKELAIRKLDNLDITPIDKAVMARDYEVDPARRWLEHAYAALGAREEPISKDEGVRLGLEAVVLLTELWERIRKRRYEKEKSKLEFDYIRESPVHPDGSIESPIASAQCPSVRSGCEREGELEFVPEPAEVPAPEARPEIRPATPERLEGSFTFPKSPARLTESLENSCELEDTHSRRSIPGSPAGGWVSEAARPLFTGWGALSGKAKLRQ